MQVIERVAQVLLRAAGVRSHHHDTAFERHHVYDAPGRGRLPPVVLLHGLADSAAALAPMILQLRAVARRVVVIEAAGHGLSGAPRATYTVDRHLDSMNAALDALLDEPAILVGNSLGGATAIRYAIHAPAKVRGLFLTSPGGAASEPAHLAGLQRTFAMKTPADARAFLGKIVHREPALAAVMARIMVARTSSRGVADLIASLGPEHTIPAEELARLAMPIRILWGRSERLLAPSELAYFRAHLPAHATIVEPDGLGHCPHLEEPARLGGLVLAFAAACGATLGSADDPRG